MKLNVIIPCFNEEGNVEILQKKLADTLGEIDYQLIFINDGSKDNTYKKLKEVYLKNQSTVKVINFSRNFGKDAAIFAGLEVSDADYTVLIDGDMQQNPKYLLDMLAYLEENEDIDIVAMVNTNRREGIFTRFFKWGFYTFMNLISDVKFNKGVSDFRMFRRSVTEAIRLLPENNRFSKGIFSWIGFNTHVMEYKVEPRFAGKRYFNFINQWRYAFRGIINFSIKPLRLATVLGFLFALIAFIYGTIILIDTVIHGSNVPGFPTLLTAILFLGGIQLMAIGLLGEYISRTYLESKKRPIYIAKSKLGFNEDIL